MVKRNTCIFISGKGSNLNNLIEKSRNYNFPINIKLVICDNKKSFRFVICQKIQSLFY